VRDDIRRVPASELDEDSGESWERVTDDPDICGVDASMITVDEQPYWSVGVAVAEFLRDGPLETELWEQMTAALEAVDGVASVWEEDREVWGVTGAPSGEALVGAAAGVVDHLAARARAFIEHL
jgi:hypothetical protein